MLADYYAISLIPTSIAFINGNAFLILEKNKAQVYKLVNNQPKHSMQLENHNTIISGLPTTNKQAFVLVVEDGRVTIKVDSNCNKIRCLS
jgi:hypothetical protein